LGVRHKARSQFLEDFFKSATFVDPTLSRAAQDHAPAPGHYRPLTIKAGMDFVIRQLAKKSSVSPAEAADQIDKFIHDVRRKLKRGETASVPGIGKLAPGPGLQVIKELNGNDKPSRTRRRRS
jgi:hypothetical protein